MRVLIVNATIPGRQVLNKIIARQRTIILQNVTARKRSTSKEKPRNLIAARMRQARLRLKPDVTQEDLSALIEAYGVHLDRLAISRIERGTRAVTDYELLAIAAALAVPVRWLLAEDKVHNPLEPE
jgi:hypothetical protein